MGQIESKEHKLFIQLLQHMIKSHGHDIKLKTVEEFVHIVRELCPWVPEGGCLDEASWKVIGEKIDQFSTRNPSLPQTDILLSVWAKLRDYVCPIPSAPPYTPENSFASPPPLSPDPLDLMERGSHHSYADPPPMDTLETVAKVVVDSSSRPVQGTPCPSTQTLPPDLIPPVLPYHSAVATPWTVCSSSCAIHSPSHLSHLCLMPSCPFAGDLQTLKLLLHTPLLRLWRCNGDAVRRYEPIPPKALRDLKDAVTQYGPTAPYTLMILDNLCIPSLRVIGGRLAMACLSGGDFLLWKAYYEDAAFDQSSQNRCLQSP
ncbi:LOW QUALITY PROTEIN: Endogenous retrovirus group K member 5 Gag polyprotein [Plecturocebus cupreus]